MKTIALVIKPLAQTESIESNAITLVTELHESMYVYINVIYFY